MVQGSVEEFLKQVARRGSWAGGGSVAALAAALAAALLEKLVTDAGTARRLRRVRRECAALVGRDADAFAHVIQATRRGGRTAFRRALRAAIEIPCRVVEGASAVRRAAGAAVASVPPKLRSDLRCAVAMAEAAAASGRILIETNLAWLHDPRYARIIRRRLRRAGG